MANQRLQKVGNLPPYRDQSTSMDMPSVDA